MTAQLDLLSHSPVARYADPETSHRAAREVSQDGSRARQQNLCLGAVKRWPGLSSAELAERMGCSRFMPARRLPECRAAALLENGPARKCAVTRRLALTWWIRGTAPKAAA